MFLMLLINKLNILGENGPEWYGQGKVGNKESKKGQRNKNYRAKNICLLSHWMYLDVEEVEILSRSGVLKNIKRGIITGIGIKAIEHKEWLSYSVWSWYFVSTRTLAMTPVSIICYHATIIKRIVENLFCLLTKKVNPRLSHIIYFFFETSLFA